MSTHPPRPARARSADEKHQRREDILLAAERLWTDTPYAELSMNQVAREAKLAKGTLYLYFDTKEELFLALLNVHLTGLLATLIRQMEERPVRTADEVADLFADAAAAHEPLRRLMILMSLVLERNVRPEEHLNFKKNLRLAAQDIVNRLPFPEKMGFRFLRHVYALSVGWQQLTEATPLGTQPRQAGQLTVGSDFDTEFRLSLRAVANVLMDEPA